MGYLTVPGAAAYVGGIQRGAPFSLDEFQSFTGILFPPFDTTLPNGLHQNSADLCKEYLESVWNVTDHFKRHEFISQYRGEGKKVFGDWYTKEWKRCNVSHKIDRFLREQGFHAEQIHQAFGDYSVTHVESVHAPLAEVLFGSTAIVALPSGVHVLKDGWESVLNALIWASYDRTKKVVSRSVKKMGSNLVKLEGTVAGEYNIV